MKFDIMIVISTFPQKSNFLLLFFFLDDEIILNEEIKWHVIFWFFVLHLVRNVKGFYLEWK